MSLQDATSSGAPRRVLVIEDDRTLLRTMAYYLERDGYEVATAADGLAGLEAARRVRPDLIVLDVMLPGMDGFALCRTLRAETQVPIIIVSARDDEIDRVVGLEIGADDYVTKPFSLRELAGRVKAKLRYVEAQRRLAARSDPATLRVGDLEIDPARHEVRRRGQPVVVKRREFDLLAYLAEHPRIVISRERLLEVVWAGEVEAGSRTVDVHVRRLRTEIEDRPERPEYLHTVRGLGYRLEYQPHSPPPPSDPNL